MASNRITLKIGKSGTIMALGIRQFPTSFYVDEWEVLARVAGQAIAFGKKHAAEVEAKRIEAGKVPKASKATGPSESVEL